MTFKDDIYEMKVKDFMSLCKLLGIDTEDIVNKATEALSLEFSKCVEEVKE